MKTLLLLAYLLVFSSVSFAQAAPEWPRNSSTGRVEFSGRLSWPDTTKTESQRQLLVRRWYRAKLTNNKVGAIREFTQLNGITYGGIPKESCYVFSIMNADNEHFSLCFQVRLLADATGLAYQFSDFECGYFAIDVGGLYPLEDVLKLTDANAKFIMNGFHDKLLFAIKGW